MTLTQIKPAGLSKPVDLADNEKIRLGTGNDFEIYHNGTHTYLQETGSGALQIRGANLILDNADGSKRYIDCNDGGSVELYHNGTKKLETRSNGIEVLGHVLLGDNYRLGLGNVGSNGDLQIYHDGSDSIILDQGTGRLNIRTNGDSIKLQNTDGGQEAMGIFNSNGSVELYYNGSKKFDTLSTGAKITGQLNFDDGSSTANTNGIGFGSSQDCRLFHSGSSFQIRNVTGPVTCITPSHFQISADSSNDTMFKAIQDGAVELYYDNSKKLHTTSGGIYVTGNVVLPDDGELKLGNSGDLSIYHNDGLGSSWIYNSTGELHIRSDSIFLRSTSDGASYVNCTDNGSVDLYYNGGKVFETGSQETKHHRRVQIHADGPGSGHGMSIGQWDGSNHRIEGDANRPIVITAYNSGGIKMGVSGANKVAVNSYGLVFNGDTAAANALDDYEEGTCTPEFQPASGSYGYIYRTGHYTRIGDVVHLTASISINGATNASGEVKIQGLPFSVRPVNSTWSGEGGHGVGRWFYAGPNHYCFLVCDNSDDKIRVHKADGTFLNHTNMSTGYNQSQFSFTVTYLTDG